MRLRDKTMTTPFAVSHEAPMKLMVCDLRRIAVCQTPGFPLKIQYLPDRTNKRMVVLEFRKVWLQGSIKHCSSDTDNIVMNDGTGDVIINKCSRVPGDCSWVKAGEYCGVLACVKLPSNSPPEVEAIKLMHISEGQEHAEKMWPLEVRELANLLKGGITFNLAHGRSWSLISCMHLWHKYFHLNMKSCIV